MTASASPMTGPSSIVVGTAGTFQVVVTNNDVVAAQNVAVELSSGGMYGDAILVTNPGTLTCEQFGATYATLLSSLACRRREYNPHVDVDPLE